jgi:hypothetical protein
VQQTGNGYSVLLELCSAICPASFGNILQFCMGRNILANEWIFLCHSFVNELVDFGPY